MESIKGSESHKDRIAADMKKKSEITAGNRKWKKQTHEGPRTGKGNPLNLENKRQKEGWTGIWREGG